MNAILAEIRACRLCSGQLPASAAPIVQAGEAARILIVSQAPGRHADESGIPFDDASGDRLRDWLNVDRATFYDPEQIAIVPMGFCYPGTGQGGDLQPRPECSDLWHARLLACLPELQLTILLGRSAQACYLPNRQKTLTATVRSWRDYAPDLFPLPHPSPRNNVWLHRNPWFQQKVLPDLRRRVSACLPHAVE